MEKIMSFEEYNKNNISNIQRQDYDEYLKDTITPLIESTKFEWSKNEKPKGVHFDVENSQKGIDMYYYYDEELYVLDTKMNGNGKGYASIDAILDDIKKNSIIGYELSDPPFLHPEQEREGVMYVIEEKLNTEEMQAQIESLDHFIELNDNPLSEEKYNNVVSRIKEGWVLHTADAFNEDLSSIVKNYEELLNSNPENEYRIVKADCLYNTWGISGTDIDYKRLDVLPTLEQVIDKDEQVRIYRSESDILKAGDVYSLDEANVMFEKAAKEILDLNKDDSIANKIKEVFLPTYSKIRGMVELPEGDVLGFRYDAGDVEGGFKGYLEENFDNKNLKTAIKNIVSIGDIIIDKDDKYRLVADIKDGNYELFPVEANDKNNINRITDIELTDKNKVIVAESFKTLNKKDIKFKAGQIDKSELDNVLSKLDLFKRKGLVQASSNNQKVELANTVESSLEL